MSRRGTALLSLLLMAFGTASAGAAGAPRALPKPIEDRLLRLLSGSVEASGAMGAQAAVRIPGYAPWSGVAGLDRPGVPMRPELMIGTGSISKMYTAMAAMVLVDRGRIGLGDTLGRWFPDTPNVDPSVTVRQLLGQASGLGDYAVHPDFRPRVLADTGRAWRPDEMLDLIGPPLFAPGRGWNAANTNRLLLGLIVERESGQSLGAFLRSEIFAGSPSSWMTGDGPVPDLTATQWIVDDAGRRTNARERGLFSTAALTTRREIQASAADIAGFGERVFAGRLLSDTLRARMIETVPSDGKVVGETGGGLGIRQYGPLGPVHRTTLGHSGANVHNRSLLLFDPATRIVVAVTINQGAGHRESHFTLAPALLQAAIEFTTRP